MRNAYAFKRSTYSEKFLFTSVGQRGNIQKVVVFDFEEDGLYSVVLGDINDRGQLQDFMPTGNNDAKKVLATVADIIEYFLEQNSKATLFFTGTTKRLTDFYKRLLLKEMDLSVEYEIEGVTKENVCEPISLNKHYEGYFIFSKNK